MTVTMTMEEYLNMRSGADQAQRYREKLNMANQDRIMWMRLYAILEDYAATKHGLDLKEFQNYVKEIEGNELIRSNCTPESV